MVVRLATCPLALATQGSEEADDKAPQGGFATPPPPIKCRVCALGYEVIAVEWGWPVAEGALHSACCVVYGTSRPQVEQG